MEGFMGLGEQGKGYEDLKADKVFVEGKLWTISETLGLEKLWLQIRVNEMGNSILAALDF